ncbi:MAG: putative lipid II flippase FtsW [Planctomycetes bacterium]|nr:putative lipid II flippase FtsW [Planctomycetota bacterium]
MMQAGRGLILIVFALLTLGVVMVNSAGLTVNAEQSLDLSQVLLGRPTILALIALIMMLVASQLNIEWLYKSKGLASPIPWMILGSLLLLAAVHVPGIGREVNGARRWITLGPIGFQPSEIAKWTMIIVIAWYAARRAESLGKFFRGFLPPMIFVGIVCVVIAMEDLGTAALIGMVAVVMLIAAGSKLWHVAVLAPPAIAGLVATIMANPYRLDRLRAFVDPYQDPQGIGYHMIQSMAAVAGGGLAGRGLGNGVQKFGYLPEDTTDFIFAVICEELGLIGGLVVVSLYAGLLLCGLSIIRQTLNPFARLVGLGVMATIGLQALINMAVVTGTAPTKGIALPLISSGGTGWVLTAFCIGLLISIDRTNHKTSPQPLENLQTVPNPT